MSERKQNGNAKLGGLTPDQADTVFAYIEQNTLSAAKNWLRVEWDIDMSEGRIADWASKERKDRNFKRLLDETRAAATFSKLLVGKLGDKNQLGDGVAALTQQLVLDILILPPEERVKKQETLEALLGHALKARDQDLKSQDMALKVRRLELLEKKEADAKNTLGNQKLTPAQREAKMREIFGITG